VDQKAGGAVKVSQLMQQISGLRLDPDMPVIVAASGDSRYNRAEPKHVQVQRVCHNSRLRPCDSAKCETAFLALVIW
jgi:hypothetical protein